MRSHDGEQRERHGRLDHLAVLEAALVRGAGHRVVPVAQPVILVRLPLPLVEVAVSALEPPVAGAPAVEVVALEPAEQTPRRLSEEPHCGVPKHGRAVPQHTQLTPGPQLPPACAPFNPTVTPLTVPQSCFACPY